MIFTPASTSSPASPWAASPGTASTPTTMSSSSTSWRSSSVWRTTWLPTLVPTFASSTSKIATTRKPWSAKMSEEAIALPRWPAPSSAMLCWPAVRRILRICETSASTL